MRADLENASDRIRDFRAQVEALTKERDEAVRTSFKAIGNVEELFAQVSSLTSRLQTIEGETIERCAGVVDRLAGKTNPGSNERASLIDAVSRIRALRSDAGGENG